MELKKIQQSTITKTILVTLGATALVTTSVVFPSLPYIISLFANDQKQKRYVKKIFRKLEKQHLISIQEDINGQITIKITEAGKLKALSFNKDSMQIKKPQKWDGIWRIVIFDIPEGHKKAREAFRSYLKRLNFYKLQKSVFVHPYHCKEEVDFLKHDFGIADFITYLEAKFVENQNILRNHFQV